MREGQLLTGGSPATGALFETLLDRGADSDVTEAAAAMNTVAEQRHDPDLPVRDIWLTLMQALLARSRGRNGEYGQLADRNLEMAVALDVVGGGWVCSEVAAA